MGLTAKCIQTLPLYTKYSDFIFEAMNKVMDNDIEIECSYVNVKLLEGIETKINFVVGGRPVLFSDRVYDFPVSVIQSNDHTYSIIVKGNVLLTKYRLDKKDFLVNLEFINRHIVKYYLDTYTKPKRRRRTRKA